MQTLPLTGDGVLGKGFEIKLKDRKEKNEEFKDLVPEISGKKESPCFKRKSSSQSGSWDSKHMRFDNERNNRNYGQNTCRTEYSTPLRYDNKCTGRQVPMDRDQIISKRKLTLG